MQKLGNPVPLFLDATGRLLDGGKIFVGVQDGDPETNPIATFFDSALTIPAAQPIRTLGGFIVNGVNPASVFIAEEDYSMRVYDSLDNLVEYSPSVFAPGASFQPLDPDLTAIAALTTQPYGRSLLTADGSDPFVTEAGTQVLTNKTLTSPTLNGATISAGTVLNDSGTISAASPGFRGLPPSSQTPGSTITLALADAGKSIPNTTGGWIIPANASVAIPPASVFILYNDSGSAQTVAITSDTLRLHGSATTGTRTVAARGLGTLIKVHATEWVATGDVT
jgi:hypothetical protein